MALDYTHQNAMILSSFIVRGIADSEQSPLHQAPFLGDLYFLSSRARGVGSPGAAVTSACNPPAVSAEGRIWYLCKRGKRSQLLGHLSRPRHKNLSPMTLTMLEAYSS